MDHQGSEMLFPVLNQFEFSHGSHRSEKQAAEPVGQPVFYCLCYPALSTPWLSHQRRCTSPPPSEPVGAVLYTRPSRGLPTENCQWCLFLPISFIAQTPLCVSVVQDFSPVTFAFPYEMESKQKNRSNAVFSIRNPFPWSVLSAGWGNMMTKHSGSKIIGIGNASNSIPCAFVLTSPLSHTVVSLEIFGQ